MTSNNKSVKSIPTIQTYQFDQEIQSLTHQLKEKITSLKKDYRDLKIFKHESDIANARQKLLVFIRKLVLDTTELIQSIDNNLTANQRSLDEIKVLKERKGQELNDLAKTA